MTFEELLNETEPALQRYVRFQIGNKQDLIRHFHKSDFIRIELRTRVHHNIIKIPELSERFGNLFINR